jgi:hypothetical protein
MAEKKKSKIGDSAEERKDPFRSYPKPGYYGARGRDRDEKAYWGPKTLEGFKDFQPFNKAPALKKTLSDLRGWQKEQYKDENVLGVNKGPNSEAVRRANSTMNRYTDYSKTLGRLKNADAKRAALKAKKK